ncbi:hypothetical protein [Flavobacterium sp. N1736]|uniref:hypothetical protein n=1 Tax=Flavobacterium sp. N1736 TaxID=2986823 RepID=UPI0022259699|nr:hypothetical protein [Flavobacterium sp. N1736]
MSTKTLSKEAEARIIDFFNKSVDPESLAKTIRKLNYVLALSTLQECQTLQINKTSVEDGFYWLNQLAEILNPYLDVE